MPKRKVLDEAKWCLNYDHHTDKLYLCPSCPNCEEPLLPDNGEYRCFSCGREFVINKAMQEWFEQRAGEQVETVKCYNCGQKTFERHMFKNPVSLEWLTMWGICNNCGMRLIV